MRLASARIFCTSAVRLISAMERAMLTALSRSINVNSTESSASSGIGMSPDWHHRARWFEGAQSGFEDHHLAGIYGIHPDHADGDEDAGIDPAQHVRGYGELLTEFGP